MELKGLTKLNKAISKELKPFGISKAELSDDYSYTFSDESVTFKVTENGLADRLFEDFVEERFNFRCDCPFVLSLLHEVGHHKANDEIDGAIYDFCFSEKERIETELAICDENDIAKIKILEYQYFNLPDEIMATQWAVNYAKAHPKKIQALWKNAKQALFEFYDANGLFDEDEN